MPAHITTDLTAQLFPETDWDWIRRQSHPRKRKKPVKPVSIRPQTHRSRRRNPWPDKDDHG